MVTKSRKTLCNPDKEQDNHEDIIRGDKMHSDKPVLLIEDDIEQTNAVKEAFGSLDIKNELVAIDSSEQALEYLRNSDNKMPALIMLDINLSQMKGLEFLVVAKNDQKLNKIPVIALASSQSGNDLVGCFELGIIGYIMKPVCEEKITDAFKIAKFHWMFTESQKQKI